MEGFIITGTLILSSRKSKCASNMEGKMKKRDYEETPVMLLEAAVLIGQIIEGHEDFVYRIPDGELSCVYTDASGNPSCIIGKLLYRLGVELPGYEAPENSKAIYTVGHLKKLFTTEALEFLMKIQMNQDSSVPWGECVESAICCWRGVPIG
jgi:hypothetical protein